MTVINFIKTSLQLQQIASNPLQPEGDGGGYGDGGDGVQPSAGTPPPFVVGMAGTGMEGTDHRCGDGW
ncbi:hypothetical protein QVD17_20339 [Tagetes erecta]|uniref:Uncharacterized protein n=1 Tax=Tagetes erecta TaxID=13708 RepID=A0AAD8NXT3_TARER|nr:hypothetical protein QVD17_20339 [Tagetes erecta]